MAILHDTEQLLKTLLTTDPGDAAAVRRALEILWAETRLMNAASNLIDAARRADAALASLPTDKTALLADVVSFLRREPRP